MADCETEELGELDGGVEALAAALPLRETLGEALVVEAPEGLPEREGDTEALPETVGQREGEGDTEGVAEAHALSVGVAAAEGDTEGVIVGV